MPYIKNVEKGREEGDTESVGQLQLSPTAESGDPPRELPRGNSKPRIILYKTFFYPPFKMIEYNQKQSKEIYNALLESKVDLLEYFLGPDPKKTSYYRKHVKRYRVKSILNDY